MFKKYFSFLLLGLIMTLKSFAISPITGVTHTCAGSTTTLHDATTGGVWVSGNGIVATVGSATGIVSGVAAGTSTITYIASAGFTTTVVTVYPLPTVYGVTGGGSYCAGDSGVHIGLLGSQLGVDYLLVHSASTTGPFAGTGASRDFGWQTDPGLYTSIATTTSTGCTAFMSGSATVTVTPIVNDSVSIFKLFGDTICAGTSVEFVAVPVFGGSTPHYQWIINGVNVGGDSAHYDYFPANGDIISVNLASSQACVSADTVTSSDTMTVLIKVTPTVDITASPDREVCRGSYAMLSANPVYGGPLPDFTWNKNGVTVATGGTYTFIPLNGDTIHCTMISDYQCLLTDTAVSPKTTMIVDTPLTPYITVVPTPGYVIGPGQFDTLRAVVINPGANPSYEWVVNGVTIDDTTDTYISNTFSSPFPDSITCIVTGSGACRVSSYSWAYIVVSSVGVSSVNAANDAVAVFPNPNNGTFTLKGSFEGIKDGETSLVITDVLGNVVYNDKAMIASGQINTRILIGSKDVAAGIYMLTLRSGTAVKTFRMQLQ